MRLERALNSKTRLAVEQLELQPGDLVDFWRKPATKDESGWRGPARVVELGDKDGDESSATTVKWQGRSLPVRTQDLRRALVYLVFLAFRPAGHKTRETLWSRSRRVFSEASKYGSAGSGSTCPSRRLLITHRAALQCLPWAG